MVARSSRPDRVVEWVRWFNRATPLNAWKPSLAKRVRSRLDLSRGLELYDGIQGRISMHLDLAVDYERQVYLNARDCTLVATVRKVLRPGDHFVDAGANLGLLTLVAARRIGPAGQVSAFEPSPEIFARLERNIAANGLENVHAFRLGCWDERREMSLHRYEGESHDTATLGSSENRKVAQTETIATVPIDEVVAGPVRLLKVDVEGAERFALRGAERLIFAGAPPHILLEANAETAQPFGYHPLELVSWILERRPEYRLHLLRTRSSRRTTVEGIREFLREHPRRAPNVWFEPGGTKG